MDTINMPTLTEPGVSYFLRSTLKRCMPTLTEPGVSYFLRSTLKRCNETKTKYFNTLWNLGLLFVFIAILGIILVYKKNTKLTDEEKKEKLQTFLSLKVIL